jgi:hypothetical protein
MLRKMILLVGSALILVSCLPVHSQDSPSLGDLARQAQKNKTHSQSARVITNDDLPSASGLDSLGLGEIGDSKSGSKPDAVASAAAVKEKELDRAESFLTKIDSMDRPTLVRIALQGVDSDFPGRGKWEERLFAAKQVYVSHGRELLQRVKQLAASAQGMQGNPSADDPRVQDLTNSLKEVVQDSTRMEAAYKAVVAEGRDLATRASSH